MKPVRNKARNVRRSSMIGIGVAIGIGIEKQSATEQRYILPQRRRGAKRLRE